MSYRISMSKDKNVVTFVRVDENKGTATSYLFDINTAVMSGPSGKALKSWPAGFAPYLRDNYRADNLLSVMYSMRERGWCYGLGDDVKKDMSCLASYAYMFKIADRMASIGMSRIDYSDCTPSTFQFLEKNFKKFAQYVRDNDNPSINRFIRDYGRELWAVEHGLSVNEHFSAEMLDTLYRERESFTEDELSCAVYYLSRGLWEFCHNACGGMWCSPISKMKEYFTMAKALGNKPEKSDFYRLYINTRRTYMMNKKEIDLARLKNQYDKHRTALMYEDDNFIVVIPTTPEQFKAEADYQHNCVYSSYLGSVLDGNTNVVFIRRKSNPNVPYITCEVSNTGNIRQYLTQYNHYVCDDDAKTFKETYWRHIRENWDA